MMHIIFFLFLTTIRALTITSPSGGIVDPTQPITVTWTATSTDPDTFDLVLGQSSGNSLLPNNVLASAVSSSSGSYTIPANTARIYGSNYVIKAVSSGATLATSPTFDLAMGSLLTGDQTSLGQSSTPVIGFTKQTAQATNDGYTMSATASATPTDNSPFSFGSSTFETSVVSRTSGSAARTSASSSASATTSMNAQPRLSSDQIAFSLAGMIAGLAALLA